MPSLLARLVRHTVWEPGAIPASERKYAEPLKRYFLPALDIILIVGGFYAVHSGIPSLDQLLPDAVSDAISYTFAALALVALVGIAYPCLWAVEIIAKCLIVGILGMYFLALRSLAIDDSNKDFVSVLVLGFILFPAFRLWILGRELRDRRAAKERTR